MIKFFNLFLILIIPISISSSNELSFILFEYIKFIIVNILRSILNIDLKISFRFPRKIIIKMIFDEIIGVIYIKWDHSYLNNYNKWFSIMTHDNNHDIQFLFIKNHVMIIIYYIMKYISKSEVAFYSKLIIAIIIRKIIFISLALEKVVW